ncbi:MAG: hypothetical protein AAGA35_02460 [Patescibacteria group bacterium]
MDMAGMYTKPWLPTLQPWLETRRFKTWQRYSAIAPSGLANWQQKNLRNLLRHATTHSPYYEHVFQSISTNTFTREQLSTLPVTDRQTLQQSSLPVTVTGLPDYAYRYRSGTSGTTGEPLHFFCAPYGAGIPSIHDLYHTNKLWRPLLWEGRTMASIKQMRRMQNTHRIMPDAPNQILVPPHSQSEGPEKTVQMLFDFEPEIISFYASFVMEIAHYVADHIKTPITIPYILLNGERLHPEQREFIESVFSGTTISRYGLEECYWSIASETVGGNELIPYHESAIIEIIDDKNRPCRVGEEGRVIVTNLANYVHPFIRYETGDRAIVTTLEPTLRFTITGRSMSLRFPSGNLSNNTVNRIMTPLINQIERYQFQKTSDTELRILLVPLSHFESQITTMISDSIRQVLGTGVSVTIDKVSSIPRTERGKTTAFVDLSATTQPKRYEKNPMA